MHIDDTLMLAIHTVGALTMVRSKIEQHGHDVARRHILPWGLRNTSLTRGQRTIHNFEVVVNPSLVIPAHSINNVPLYVELTRQQSSMRSSMLQRGGGACVVAEELWHTQQARPEACRACAARARTWRPH